MRILESEPTAPRPVPAEPHVHVSGALIRRHQAMVWRYLRFLGAPTSLSDDLCQETFLRLLESPPLDRGDAAIASWLRTTARNLYFRAGRSARAGLEFVTPSQLEAAWVQWIAHDSDGSLYQDALAACVQTLTPRAREALRLRYAGEVSREEMGELLGMRTEGVKTLLRRARESLLDCIRRRTPEPHTPSP